MEALSANFNSCQVVLRVLVPITELSQGFIATVHHNVVVFCVFNAFIDGPKSIDFLEIIEVHPENTIVTTSIKSNLVSKLFGPEGRRITPVSIPFATTPWVSQLDESNSVSIDV